MHVNLFLLHGHPFPAARRGVLAGGTRSPGKSLHVGESGVHVSPALKKALGFLLSFFSRCIKSSYNIYSVQCKRARAPLNPPFKHRPRIMFPSVRKPKPHAKDHRCPKYKNTIIHTYRSGLDRRRPHREESPKDRVSDSDHGDWDPCTPQFEWPPR